MGAIIVTLNMGTRPLFVIVIMLSGACATGNIGQNARVPASPNVTNTVSVGLAQLRFEDATRHRPLPTRIWYPSKPTPLGRGDTIEGIFVAHSATNAPLASSPQQFPLVLLSHGTGGGSSNLVWLAEHLAQHGYLVAAVDHFGNTFGNNSTEGVVSVWRRPRDITYVLDALLTDPLFGSRIAVNRIGAAGFSAGGYTVIALAGGRYHPELMAAYCSQHPTEVVCQLAGDLDVSKFPDRSSASASYSESRIRAVFAMAPAVGQGFAQEDLASVSVPVSIVAGLHDEVLPFQLNAQRYAQFIAGSHLTALESGGHYVFMPLCNPRGFQYAREVCADIAPSVDRKAIHERVEQLALKFFDEHLR